MATSPSSASGTSSPSSSGGAANLLAALAGATPQDSPSANASSSSKHEVSASKYHKLAAEYSKLRSHLGVLKKAMLDEQAKTAELEENIKAKELAERKREAEREAIQFRNQQLTKRIQVLQEEIEEQEQRLKHQKRGGKTNSSSSTLASASAINHSESINSVIGEELQAKIDENASLHARLSDVDRRYEDLVSSLRGRISELESEARERAQLERAEDTKHKDVLAGLRSDKEELEKRIRTLEGELVDQQDRITVLTVQLESASGVGNNSSPTNSSNNFPLTASDARVQSVELLSQFGDRVTGLVASFSDFHTYWEHRLKDLSADGGALWDSAASLSRLLLQNVSYLKPVEEAYQRVLSEVLSNGNSGSLPSVLVLFADFSKSFKAYVGFALEAETLTVSCLQYESHRYSCPPSQQAFNTQLGSSLHAFNRVLSRAADYLQTAVGVASDERLSMETLDALSVCLSQLATQAGELSRTYANKASDESALPTVTEQLKNTNQCIVAALASIEQGVGETSRLMATNLHRIELLIKSVGAEDGATVSDMDKQRSGKSESPNDDSDKTPDSKLAEELNLVKEKEKQLQSVISNLQDKTKELEQKREHWKLEFQLLKMKYEKLKGDDSLDDDATSENDPLRQRIKDVLNERVLADSKACSLVLELWSHRKRLREAERRRRKALKDLESCKIEADRLKEEVGTTSAGYEGQLGLMTEHVANMNDKLSAQTDEIERLKFELKGGGKKAKGKK